MNYNLVIIDELSELQDLNKKISPEEALVALEDMDDYARMQCSVEAIGPVHVLRSFILQNWKD